MKTLLSVFILALAGGVSAQIPMPPAAVPQLEVRPAPVPDQISFPESACLAIGVNPYNVRRSMTVFDKKTMRTIPYGVLYYYRQSAVNTGDDYIGDLSLAMEAKKAPKKIIKTMKKDPKYWAAIAEEKESGRECARVLFGNYVETPQYVEAVPPWVISDEESAGLEDAGLTYKQRKALKEKLQGGSYYLESKQNPLNKKGFLKMIERIVQEERLNGITPTRGTPHKWSKKFVKSFSEYEDVTSFSKLLVAMALGKSYQYMATGKEEALKAYVLARPVRSIMPHEMFRASYRLNNGDMYLTLLTVENMLSVYWRDPNREQIDTSARLARITNCMGDGCDNFGPYYHMFGMMLYGYVKGKNHAKAIGNIEAYGSLVLGKGAQERQENAINRRAGVIGAGIRKVVKHADEADAPEEALDPANYLNVSDSDTWSDTIRKAK